MFTALTIAGSDSGGGAGIQADLKSFAARHVYGTSALTAITAQNTRGVSDVVELSPAIIAAQIDAVLSDIGAHAIKTGMLSSVAIIETVAHRLIQEKVAKLVVDPVMVAKSGDKLLHDEAVSAIKELLLPLALVVTPNRYEAAILCEHDVRSLEEMEAAARAIARFGARHVVVKGGLHHDQSVDVLWDGERIQRFATPHLRTRSTQGTGCTFSAAIAAELAKGETVHDAVQNAKQYVFAAMKHAPNIGSGHGPLNHFPPQE
ncbi:MAG: hydroxymethylpyrimidine/phosphomethylpyrimidine kinase [Abditibacteriota bacterium]|nr:hydroxymethylpyrimidine/phosphomethylpyrimidine kinase [Abditibacteriota bacterium]